MHEISQYLDYFYLTEEVTKKEGGLKKVEQTKITRQMSNLLNVNAHGVLEANISLESVKL